MKPQKLTKDEIELLTQLGSPLLTTLAKWTDSRMTCAHCKKCTLRCKLERLRGAEATEGILLIIEWE